MAELTVDCTAPWHRPRRSPGAELAVGGYAYEDEFVPSPTCPPTWTLRIRRPCCSTCRCRESSRISARVGQRGAVRRLLRLPVPPQWRVAHKLAVRCPGSRNCTCLPTTSTRRPSSPRDAHLRVLQVYHATPTRWKSWRPTPRSPGSRTCSSPPCLRRRTVDHLQGPEGPAALPHLRISPPPLRLTAFGDEGVEEIIKSGILPGQGARPANGRGLRRGGPSPGGLPGCKGLEHPRPVPQRADGGRDRP